MSSLFKLRIGGLNCATSDRSHRLITCVAVIAIAEFAPAARGQCVSGETQKLLASDGVAEDDFGYSTAISGDVVVVGARNFSMDGGDQMGAAYFYRWDGERWVEELKVVDPALHHVDYFGASAAVDGDVAIIGAGSDDEQADDSGAAYVFRYDGATWVLEQKLLASDGNEDDFFGSVSIHGDVVIVGAPGDADLEGSAYIFRYDGETWIEEQKLLPSNPVGDAVFGTFVSIHGDAAIVGSYWDAANGYQAGAAYIYRYDPRTANWVEEIKLLHPEGEPEDNFGWDVDICGDTAIVGSRNDDDAGSNAGAAFIYRHNGVDWILETKLLAGDGVGQQWFGYSVAIDGDTALCGAWKGNGVDEESGAAYLFRFDGAEWIEEAKVYASNGVDGDEFGFSADLAGERAIVGARDDDDNGNNSGAAFIFDGLGDCNANGAVDICDIADGASSDCNQNGLPDECEPPNGDVDCDADVDGVDLITLLGAWGRCEDCDECVADLDGDCVVGTADLIILLSSWG